MCNFGEDKEDSLIPDEKSYFWKFRRMGSLSQKWRLKDCTCLSWQTKAGTGFSLICIMGPDEKESSLNNWASKRKKKWGNSHGPTYTTVRNNNFVMLLPHLRKGGCRIGSSHRSVWAGWGRKGAAEGDCTSGSFQGQGMDSVSQESLSDLVMDNCLSTGKGVSCGLPSRGIPKGKRSEREMVP